MAELKLPPLRYVNSWVLTNFGIPFSIHQTRMDAIKEAECVTGLPWHECGKYMEVRKCRIVEGWK